MKKSTVENLTAAPPGNKSSINIQRLAPEDAPSSGASSASTDVYVDQLIDAALTGQPGPRLFETREDSSSDIFHSINAAAYYRDNFKGGGDALDTGIEYLAFMPTHNYGDLRLNLVALDEDSNNFFNQGDSLAVGSVSNRQQQGLRRYSIEQLGLPINEQLSMDNILGTHRQSRNLPFRNRVTVVNQRFGASEPDILGLTTRLYSRSSGVAFSTGEIGDTHGTVLPGFVKTDGKVHRLLGHHISDYYTLSADLWNTTDHDDSDLNRVGARINWQAIWNNELESTATLATSDDSLAALFGLSQGYASGFKHDGGVYYFEPEFIWIDTKIGDDYLGAYYRFNHQYRTLYYSGTLEQRRDGLKDDSKRERDTTYLSLNGNYRLNRESAISGTYSFREIQDRSDEPSNISSTEHTVRGTYSTQHTRNTRSNIGGTYRDREASSFQRANYSLFHDFENDSSAELQLEYTHEDGEVFDSDRYHIDLSWQRYFYNGGNLAVGTGYSYGEDNSGDDEGWNGYINYDLNIGRHWGFSAQLDYNRAEYRTDDGIFSDDLFTDNQFIEEEAFVSEEFSALFNIRYNFGGNGSSSILASNGASRGSGRIVGRLFLDANGDGRAQPDEKGLEGITYLWMSRCYPYPGRSTA